MRHCRRPTLGANLAYEVTYTRGAIKQLKKLDRVAAGRILDYMDEIGTLPDPRTRGKGLTGDRQGIWRYRVGEYRVLCSIDDTIVTILVLDAGHRRHVYD